MLLEIIANSLSGIDTSYILFIRGGENEGDRDMTKKEIDELQKATRPIMAGELPYQSMVIPLTVRMLELLDKAIAEIRENQTEI